MLGPGVLSPRAPSSESQPQVKPTHPLHDPAWTPWRSNGEEVSNWLDPLLSIASSLLALPTSKLMCGM